MKSFPKPLTPTEEKRAIRLMRQGCESAREELILHNLRLVAHVIKKYNFPDSEQEEYISIGIVGLVKAIDSFDDSKGIRLATYASRCIDNEILMVLRTNKKLTREVFLNDPIGHDKEGNEIHLLDILISPDSEPGSGLIRSEQVSMLRKALDEIKDGREREILYLRYGFYGDRQYTQREIAEMYGISRSYVSRIEKKALDGIRSYLESM